MPKLKEVILKNRVEPILKKYRYFYRPRNRHILNFQIKNEALKKKLRNIETKHVVKKIVPMSEFRKQIATLVAGAFSLVAALSWNEAIKQFITSPTGMGIPTEGSWPYLTLAAVFVTFIAAVAIMMSSRVFGRTE